MHIQGLTIGHAEDTENQTGVSVFLFDQPATCGYWLCGSAPALRDVQLLNLETSAKEIHGLVLTGGSAFGLDVTSGVMQWLAEQGKGLQTPHRRIPLVPTAGIYDFDQGNPVAPTPELAYRACQNAGTDYLYGRVGAGYGASAGKAWHQGTPTRTGIGLSSMRMGEHTVTSVAVVNAVGDIYEDNQIIAGARDPEGNLINLEKLIANGQCKMTLSDNQNTVLVANFIDAKLPAPELTLLSKMATAGIARSVRPSFTPFDGDIIFTAGVGAKAMDEPDMIRLGTICAQNVEQAIINSVKHSL
ncbi:P1 family peptidase [Dongshaea marina]|uniref:P1 family peptidase n=1 Tax=Dongshaea marina TaxID=2047966 RepID=UPI00131EF0CE|nr:P1 family peptidase [Dongshaea marina]